MDDRLRQRILEQAEKVWPMKLILRLAVAALELAPCKRKQTRIRLHVASGQLGCDVADAPRLVAQAERLQNLGAIRRDVDSGADLAELWRLLVDLDVKA